MAKPSPIEIVEGWWIPTQHVTPPPMGTRQGQRACLLQSRRRYPHGMHLECHEALDQAHQGAGR